MWKFIVIFIFSKYYNLMQSVFKIYSISGGAALTKIYQSKFSPKFFLCSLCLPFHIFCFIFKQKSKTAYSECLDWMYDQQVRAQYFKTLINLPQNQLSKILGLHEYGRGFSAKEIYGYIFSVIIVIVTNKMLEFIGLKMMEFSIKSSICHIISFSSLGLYV